MKSEQRSTGHVGHIASPSSLSVVASVAAQKMVRGWLAAHGGNVESLARWMRDSLRIGGLRECRALIVEAVS